MRAVWLCAAGDGLLFPAAGDPTKHLASATLYKVFYKAREEAGRPDLPCHDLRHTGAVLAASTGATLAELMARLEHRRSSIALPTRGQESRQGHSRSLVGPGDERPLTRHLGGQALIRLPILHRQVEDQEGAGRAHRLEMVDLDLDRRVAAARRRTLWSEQPATASSSVQTRPPCTDPIGLYTDSRVGQVEVGIVGTAYSRPHASSDASTGINALPDSVRW